MSVLHNPNWEPPRLYYWIFGEDSILPEQFASAPKVTRGVRGLLLAILTDGIETALGKRLNENGYTSKQKSQQRRVTLVQEAREWIASDADNYLFTFIQCCQHLGINPAWLRKVI